MRPGVPLHGGSRGIAAKVKTGHIQALGILNLIRRYCYIAHTDLFSVVDRWRTPEGEQKHGGDFGLLCSYAPNNSKLIMISQNPIRPATGGQGGFIFFNDGE